jgi:hypothetical protein
MDHARDTSSPVLLEHVPCMLVVRVSAKRPAQVVGSDLHCSQQLGNVALHMQR